MMSIINSHLEIYIIIYEYNKSAYFKQINFILNFKNIKYLFVS
jgi:hypothetical protein